MYIIRYAIHSTSIESIKKREYGITNANYLQRQGLCLLHK